MSERSDEPSLKCENCGGLYLTCECIHWRKPTTAPADVPIASSYREGESVIASSYRPEPTARQWWSEKRQLCSTPPPHKPMFEVLHLIEYAAYERLQFELAHMTEKFERNSIAAGEYSLRVEELERNSGEFIHWESHNVEKLEAALEAKEAELDKANAHIKMQGEARASCQWEYNKVADERDQARAELAEAKKRISDSRLYAQDRDADAKEYHKELTASQEREARLREALENITAGMPNEIIHMGYRQYAEHVLAEHGKVGG